MNELEKWEDKCRRLFEENRSLRRRAEETERAAEALGGIVDTVLIAVCERFGVKEEDGSFTLTIAAPLVEEIARHWRLTAEKTGDGHYCLRAARKPPEDDEDAPPA